MIRISSKKCDPIYLELKDMMALLMSIREMNGLWSSRFNGDNIDLFLSSIILWFTKDAFEKMKLKREFEESLSSLASLIKLRLSNINTLEDLSFDELIEVLQSYIVLDEFGSTKDLQVRLAYIFNHTDKKTLRSLIINTNPYTNHLSTLIILILFSIDKKLIDETNYIIIRDYFEQIEKGIDPHIRPDPSALYWMIILASKLFKENIGKHNEIVSKLYLSIRNTVEFIIRKMASRLNLDKIPYDTLLWLFHILDELVYSKQKSGEDVDNYLKRLYNSVIHYILSIGRVLWINSTYGSVLYRYRKERNILRDNEGVSIDLITLSLLISALVISRKCMVTFVTEYDLRNLNKVEKAAFILGLIMFSLGIIILIKIFDIATFITNYIEVCLANFFNIIVDRGGLSITVLIFLLSIIAYLIKSGVILLNEVYKGSIRKTNDIKRILLSMKLKHSI